MKDMSSHIKLAGLLAGLEQRSMGLYDSTDALGSSSVTDRMQHVLYLLFEDYIRIDKSQLPSHEVMVSVPAVSGVLN